MHRLPVHALTQKYVKSEKELRSYRGKTIRRVLSIRSIGMLAAAMDLNSSPGEANPVASTLCHGGQTSEMAGQRTWEEQFVIRVRISATSPRSLIEAGFIVIIVVSKSCHRRFFEIG